MSKTLSPMERAYFAPNRSEVTCSAEVLRARSNLGLLGCNPALVNIGRNAPIDIADQDCGFYVQNQMRTKRVLLQEGGG